MLHDNFRQFHLTYDMETYLRSIARCEAIWNRPIFKQEQIDLFLNLVLKAGAIQFLYKENCHFIQVSVYGVATIQDKYRFRIYLNEGDTPQEVMVNIDRDSMSTTVRNMVYAKCTVIESNGNINCMDLTKWNLPRLFLHEKFLPLYLNNPFLAPYAKSKIGGMI